ncbi:MAG: J domain-containing protein [Polyangiales bacterium]
MDALPSATTVARVLLRLGRMHASGSLMLQAGSHRARLTLDAGQVTGATFQGELSETAADTVAGVYRLSRHRALVLRFHTPESCDSPSLEQSIDARALAIQMTRVAVRALGVADVRRELGSGHYRLSSSDDAILEALAITSEERALASWLVRGVHADDVLNLPGCGLRAYRFLCVLKLVGVALPRGGGSYPLMLRKRRQVRDAATPHALLDLPEGAGGDDARRALRKLVGELHPDRFGEESSPGLRRASGEVVSALVAAHQRIATLK